jgi:hypothetical protein
MSLVSLAEAKNLPLHQYMDADTIEWIARNNPFAYDHSRSFTLSSTELSLLRSYAPLEEWFLMPVSANTIHGVRHLLRVAACALALVRAVPALTPKLSNLLVASVLHDVRRLHDKEDPAHGQRAAEWFRDRHAAIASRFSLNFAKHDIEEIAWSMFYHNVAYAQINEEPSYSEHKLIVDALKTADAMDRYRLPKLKWWFDGTAVRLAPEESMLPSAYWLVVHSERHYLTSRNNVHAVLDALQL